MQVREGLSKIQNQILDVAESSVDALSEAELLSRISGRRQIKIKELRRLLHSGHLVTSGSGKRGDPFMYEITKISTHEDNSRVKKEMQVLSDIEKQNLVDLFRTLLDIKKTPKDTGTSKK